MMVALARLIMRGLMPATMVVTVAAFLAMILPPFSIISAAAIALVTLRLGAGAGFKVMLSAALAALVLAWAIWQLPLIAGSFALFIWLPALLTAWLLRFSRQLSLTVEIVVAIGMTGVALFFLWTTDATRFWQDILNAMLAPMIESLGNDPSETIQIMARYMTGLIFAGSVFSVLLALFLARWWQAALYNPGGFAEEYLALTTHRSFTVVMLLILAAAVILPGSVQLLARNATLLMLVLYSLIGASVLHALIKNLSQSRIWLPLFYLLLFLVPQTLIPVILAGVSDSWFNWRQRLNSKN